MRNTIRLANVLRRRQLIAIKYKEAGLKTNSAMLVPFLGGVLALSVVADASAQASPWVGQIKVSRGIVALERGGQKFPAPVGVRLKENDVILTEANGSVGLMFNDNSVLSMGPNGEVLLERYAYDSTTYLGAFDAFVKRGAVSIEAGNLANASPESVRVKTPLAEIRGQARNFAVNVEGK
ncbi:MAG: FecR domain-containing protein [Dechloromonas sp.]|uniref:FecR domain-containing protein n=1 Tax=Candidatus Dechloromonas phosphorivorans TaxID=2899244 RepID=A0A935MZ90_9RHOO|nr:FecR domain-containing protein [Candidatus Dechloromonas phosphorivorans]